VRIKASWVLPLALGPAGWDEGGGAREEERRRVSVSVCAYAAWRTKACHAYLTTQQYAIVKGRSLQVDATSSNPTHLWREICEQ
jgi:hypothetical protein